MATREERAGTATALSADRVRAILREILHPDLGINIVDLGLVYGIEVQGRDVRVRMTMMPPDNPSRGLLIDEVESLIRHACGRFAESPPNLSGTRPGTRR